jgi:propanediol dehydratase small subunit
LKTPSSYPLAEKHHESLKTPSGTAFDEITLDALMNGRIRMEDLRVTAEALEMQAEIAESAGRAQLGENLRRAAELVQVPEKEIIEIYNALRPGRADRARLHRLADSLEQRYAAPRCAALIREAAAAYG